MPSRTELQVELLTMLRLEMEKNRVV